MSVTIPTSFNNPVVFVISDSSLPITTTDTKVSIYYADIDKNSPVKLIDLYNKLTNVSGKMHVRGDATAAMPKQQYAVKLKDKPSPENFIGMDSGGKHWVFNDCGAVDYTLLRNTFAFNQQSAMGQYAPAYKFFELFILPPGSDLKTIIASATDLATYYHGLYLNFDKIRFQGSRIDLPYKKKKKDMTSDYAIVQLNQSSDKYLSLPKPPVTGNVEIYEPKLKDISSTIQTEFSNWLYNGPNPGWATPFANIFSNYIVTNKISEIPTDAFDTIRKTTDYTSFAIYFLLNEIAKDPDGYHKSTFMVKNKTITQAGPLWDKNKSYGNVASCSQYSQGYTKSEGWLYIVDAQGGQSITQSGQSPVWWRVLLLDPQFAAKVWEQWGKMKTLHTANPINSFIDTEVSYIKTTGALARDSDKWSNAFNSSKSVYSETKYDAQITDLKNYLSKRITWINDNLPAKLAQSGFIVGAV
jgi:hypothetical protein